MITPDLVLQALKTCQEPCKDACLHADACEEMHNEIEHAILVSVRYALEQGVSPAIMTFMTGLHVGYRLHQLETTATPKELVN